MSSPPLKNKNLFDQFGQTKLDDNSVFFYSFKRVLMSNVFQILGYSSD
ncbi:hypothetical protein BH10BAC4_BH10BAC4_14760 [soil metagenome]